MSAPLVDISVARQLLDFEAGRITPARADAQLAGAVAIHNLLRQRSIAYLADEVGMGKTYVALGALALFRHFDPNFRVLIIAPRENIQIKWQKELRNFISNNVKVDDLRVRSIDHRPARSLVHCGSLLELVRETSLDPDRDFFSRMTSFSLPLGTKGESLRLTRDALRKHLPWLSESALDLRMNKEAFKKSFARAVCCALPVFDLVIVDEAHNFKHGFSHHASARNQVLGTTFGRDADGDDAPDPRLFPGYGHRAKRVLFLSATPLEETYRHVWGQLDLFGRAEGFEALARHAGTEEEREQQKELAKRFMVRRVTSMRVGGHELTKNLYRSEWREGGVATHDEPIEVTDDRQRLVVALVQKKVSELLSGKRFNRSFQMGMLASFESFLETARLKRDEDEKQGAAENPESVFDDAEQTDDQAARDGMDVNDLNRLAKSYADRFNGETLPHPKMDAVVDSLASSWQTGKKALVFVRRVASVKELKKKLDERYDRWLLSELRARLPSTMHPELATLERAYRKDKTRRSDAIATPVEVADGVAGEEDEGGNDTFFAWYFRGTGPKGYLSGANLQTRFIRATGAYATFFSDNPLMDLLGTSPGTVLEALAGATALPMAEVKSRLCARAAHYVSHKAQRVTRAAALEAMQAAGVELLRDGPRGTLADRARVIWEERYRDSMQVQGSRTVAPLSDEHLASLERETFFTALRRPEHEGLRDAIWPDPVKEGDDEETFRRHYRERELRGQFLASAARLGHAFIDLYLAAMAGRTSLASDGDQADEPAGTAGDEHLINGYLRLLETQRTEPGGRWSAFHELAEISEHFDLIIDVNAPEARPTEAMALGEGARRVGQLLGQQHPVGGMAGHLNKTLIRQFRMPGYPFVLVTTDLLQEGEDLHTFCSSVHHYGISWTPSAMEQRIGRIDRVRSQTDRRLSALQRAAQKDELLQVHFPYLRDTVEVLQVERVLERMNTFLRLMHEGLPVPKDSAGKVDVGREMVAGRRRVEKITEVLRSAFPVLEHATRGTVTELAVSGEEAASLSKRFAALRIPTLGGRSIQWAESSKKGTLLGTATVESGRGQPFALTLHTEQGRPLVRCVSPIGRTDLESGTEHIVALASQSPTRVAAVPARQARSYDLTVEDDVLLASPEHDAVRVGLLVRGVVEEADHIEREHYDDERDAKLDVFADDLSREGGDHE